MPTGRLPQISGKHMVGILLKKGFSVKSQKGSHIKVEGMVDLVRTVIIVPDHKVLKKGTLHDILKVADISPADLRENF